MTPISSRAKIVANYTAAAFLAKKPPISRMWDDDHKSSIHVLEAADRPQEGVISYATVGLSEYPLMREGEEFRTRVELLGACGAAFSGFDRVLATLSFCVINSKWFCAPGVIFPGVMDMYNLSVTMNDVYFANPFIWEGKFESFDIEGRSTAWLLAVPVSARETAYATHYGPQKLEELFSEQDIDIYNLNRAPVI